MTYLLLPSSTNSKKLDKNDEQLEVRGYACKLFRDDEKAFLQKTGAYLVPWNGKRDLLVDR